MGGDLADLHALRAWCRAPAPQPGLPRLARRAGTAAIPLLVREIAISATTIEDRFDRPREALAVIASIDDASRARVIAALQALVADPQLADDAKLAALGLLAELGVKTQAQFADPLAIQRRSALALASQLESRADVASAADLVVRSLVAKHPDSAGGDDVMQLLAAMRPAAPESAAWLADELAIRLDVDAALRAKIAATYGSNTTTPHAPSATKRTPRPTRVAVLVDAAARLVVVASRKVNGERRWRRWAVLIGQAGAIDDCLHDDTADGDTAASLVDSLTADGYRVASHDLDHARPIVVAAARATGSKLGSAYYLGRDLLDLDDAHVTHAPEPVASIVDRALELVAARDTAGAEALLARLDAGAANAPDAAAALAACYLARGDHASAIAPLEAAIAGEPDWPLHHWNAAIAHRALGDVHAAYHATRRFLTTSALPSGLAADPEQPARVACAERLAVELERTARLTGTSLRKKRRRLKT